MFPRAWSRARAGSVDQRPDPVGWTATEELLTQFFRSYTAAGGPNGLRLVGRARSVVQAMAAARSLPLVTVRLADTTEGRAIRAGFAHLTRRTVKTGFVRTPLHETASVQILPTEPGQYSTGAPRQTLRRKARAAERAGVRWAHVDDVAERRRLIAVSEARERRHPQEQYRSEDVDNSRLLHLSLWLVAYTREGDPLLIAALPVDGEWSMLFYFRTLDDTQAASDTRYLMSGVLAEELVARGVRYLVDTSTMSNLSEGLRHFQRMLGYRLVRIRVRPSRSRAEHLQALGRTAASSVLRARPSTPAASPGE